jgi:amidohydrolase
VVSVTSIHAGETFNVIPQTIELKGTIRTFEKDVRELVIRRFEEIVHGVGEAMGCQVEIDLQMLTPAVVNDPAIAQRVYEEGMRIFPNGVFDTTIRTMVSEDMAYMMQDIPGCYFLVGSANPDIGLNAPHHHPRFDIDEEALSNGVALLADVIASYLM